MIRKWQVSGENLKRSRKGGWILGPRERSGLGNQGSGETRGSQQIKQPGGTGNHMVESTCWLHPVAA